MKLFEFCFSLTVLCVALTTTSGWFVGGGGGLPIPAPVPTIPIPTIVVPTFACTNVEKYIGSALLKLILLPGFLPVTPNAKIKITCKDGTQTSSGESGFTITCVMWKGWQGKQECIPIKCNSLRNPTNGRIQFTSGTNYNSRARYTCNTGYRLPGSKAYLDRTCGKNGWSGSHYSCTVFNCGALSAPLYGAVNYNGATTYGKVATYTCDNSQGYVLSGSATRKCQNDGWSGSAPRCKLFDCQGLTSPANGAVSHDRGTTFGKVATYTCNEDRGYVLSGSATRTCQINEWSGSPPTCEIFDCQAPPAPANGAVSHASGTTFGKVATYTCNRDRGYVMSGSATRTCQINEWSGSPPTCNIHVCDTLTAPAHGYIRYLDGRKFGTEARYQCDFRNGYVFSGSFTGRRTCTLNGWDGSDGTCELRNCGMLRSPTNGGVTYSKGTTFGSVATYSCDQQNGYKLLGLDTSSCGLKGWDGTTPTCVRVECPLLQKPSNGKILYKDGLFFGSIALYSCDESKGYKLTGNDDRTCQFNGAWSGLAPKCEMKDCGNLISPKNGGVTYSKGTTFGSVATYTCDQSKGYKLIGTDTQKCELLGWIGKPPTCVRVECPMLLYPSNGAITYTDRFYFESVATYSCDERKGYKLTGSPTRACQFNGAWSPGRAPTCTLADCGKLNPPPYADISYSKGLTTFGQEATYSCDENKGYLLSGPDTRTCELAGWSGSAPKCKIKDCLSLPAPANGTVRMTLRGAELGMTTFGTEMTYSCDEAKGYKLSGSAKRKCQLDGWSGSAPTCNIVDCGNPIKPLNGYVKDTGTTFGGTSKFACVKGYNLIGPNERKCEVNGEWSGVQPTCEIVDCGKNPNPQNGIVKHTGTTFGETADFECFEGYNLIGDKERICEFNGEWSGVKPICDVVECENLLPISNGYFRATGTTYDKTATFFCNVGYSITGNIQLKCQADGNWSGALPVCTIVDCGIPDAPENGKVSYSDGTTYEDLAVYTCDAARGYKLPGSDTSYSRTCEPNKQWSGAVPTCNLVDCGSWGPPVHGTASLHPSVSGENGPKFGAVVTYSCKEGYKMIGSATSTCQLDGWSDPQPTCHIVDCQYLPPISNGTISYSGTTFRETATISCDEGYNLNGVAERKCEAGGQWSDAQPSCQIVDCQALPPLYMGSISYTGTTVYEVATSSCSEGYELSGDIERKCLPDGLWSGTETTCAIVDCNVLPPFNKGSITYTGTTFNEVATYSCDEGYKLLGDTERKCQADGQWAGTLPKCESLPSDNSNPNAGCSVNDIIGIHDCQYNCYKQLSHLNADTEGKIYDTVTYASCLAFCYRQQVAYDNETLPLLPSPPSGSGTAGTERNFRSTLCYNKCLLAPSQYNGACELAEYTIFTQCVAFCLLQREEVKLTISTVSVSSPGEMMIVQVEYLQCYVPCIRNYRQTAGPGCLSADYIESTVCHGQCLAATEKVLQDRTKRQTPSVLPQTQLEEGRLSTVKCQAQCLLKLNKPSTSCIVDNLWLLNQCVNDCLFIIPINARLDIWGTNSMPV